VSSADNPTVCPVKPARIISVDALRGFDMFWICGGKYFFFFFIAICCGGVPKWLNHQFSHVKWEGFVAYDLIMPLFLFIVGVAMPFSLLKRVKRDGLKKTYFKIFRRFLILWVLGMIAQGNLLKFNLDELKLYSNTLQSIAIGYLGASIMIIHLRVRWQIVVTIGLLLGFCAIMMFAPIPGVEGVGHLEPELNFARYVDQVVLGSFGTGGTYTWVLSSMTFITSVMLGVFGGEILRLQIADWKKAMMVLGLGLLCLGLGWIWSLWFPIIKHLWTSSMVLWAGGWSYILLGLFYLVIDVWKFRRWSFPFIVIGANAIFTYMINRPFKITPAAESLVGGLIPHLPSSVAHYTVGATMFVLLWLVLLYMYRKGTFVRI
jgi:predicted acyltransferase